MPYDLFYITSMFGYLIVCYFMLQNLSNKNFDALKRRKETKLNIENSHIDFKTT